MNHSINMTYCQSVQVVESFTTEKIGLKKIPMQTGPFVAGMEKQINCMCMWTPKDSPMHNRVPDIH